MVADEKTSEAEQKSRDLARRLGRFDATMIVMGGIVGSGIFINTYVVARQVTTPFLTVYKYPANSLIGVGIMVAGLPAYLFWPRRN